MSETERGKDCFFLIAGVFGFSCIDMDMNTDGHGHWLWSWGVGFATAEGISALFCIAHHSVLDLLLFYFWVSPVRFLRVWTAQLLGYPAHRLLLTMITTAG